MPRFFPAIVLVSAVACAACGDVTLKDPDAPDARADAPDAREGTPDAGDLPDAQPVSTADARVPDAGEPPDPLPCVEGDAQSEDPGTGTCYMLFLDPRPWDEALFVCASLGADTHLAALTSVDEHQVVIGLTAGVLDIWLGATDSNFEGQFVWITGELMDFNVWADGEPNDGDVNGEDCAILINSGARAGFWDDRACETAYPYVCERN